MKNNLSDVSQEELQQFYKMVSSNVKKARISAGMSQMDLALKLGIKSVAFYSNCENLRYGKHFNLEHIYKISKALNIKMSKILEDEKMGS
ncbi:MAG: helix-turn-helix transcriptional regulator [Sulfurovaceae bacterium]|nr:helix-turn-helix transcriptional regulator [Sulfurovaceae bacterium]